MLEVTNRAGRRYILLKRSHESSLVVDVETGERTYLPNDSLVFPEEQPELLSFIADHGPVSVRTLLDRTTYCESDLHGRLTELRAGELIDEVTVYGERGYALTDRGKSVLDQS